MIVDDALTAGEYMILQAVLNGELDEHTPLPDAVEAALHRSDAMEKAGNADHLKRYWAHGAGAKKIGWGSKGDFARCVAAVGRHMDDPEGYCNLRHKDATGEYPGQHAARLKKDEDRESLSPKGFRVLEKFNRNHDRLGRFATAPGAGAAMHTEAPEFDSWDEGLQQEYQAVVADSTHEVEGLMIAAEAHGMVVGMTQDDAATYSHGVARRALSAAKRREAEGSIDFDRRSYSKKVEEWRGEGRPTIAVHETTATAIFRDGRVKSQFETGYSNGMFAPKERAAAEVEMFNHPPNLPPNRRTVYGFVAMPGLESQRSVDQYGPVRLVLKDDVKARTTMTVGDSLSNHAMPIPMTGKVTAAQRYDASEARDGGYVRYQAGAFTHERFSRARYAEAQIHGGVSVKDIAEVHLPESFIPKTGKPWHPIVQAAYDAGIPTVWYNSSGDPQRTRKKRVAKPVVKALPLATRPDGGVLYDTGKTAGFGDPLVYAVIDGVTYEPAPLQAVIAKDPTWEKVVTKAIRVMEKHLPGQHNQQSHAGGRIGTHTGMRIGETKDDAKAQVALLDDPTAMANLPQALQDKMVESAASMGATPEALEANIEACLMRAGGPTGPGAGWYEQANRECAAVGKDAGIPHEQAVGMVAAISPQMAWAPNLAVARYLAENRDQPINTAILSEPLSKRVGAVGQSRVETRTRYEWAQMEVHGRNLDKELRVMPSMSALEGKKFSDLDPYVAASLLKAHAQAGQGLFNGKRLTGQLSVADDITGKMTKVNFPGTIQTGRGLRIARGEDANGIINGHKVRSFRNNMLNPTDTHGDITVDSHAVSLALGRKISSSSPEYAAFTGASRKGSTLVAGPTSAALGVKGSYALWADAYRRVAARHGIRPNQLQSITWIQWRKEHPDNARSNHAMDKSW